VACVHRVPCRPLRARRRSGYRRRLKATALPLLLAAIGAAHDAAAQPAQVTLDLGVPLELTLVPAGSFRQGSPADEAERHDDEAARDVTLTRAYYLGVVPVTRAQFERFVTDTSYRTEAEVGRSGGFGLEGTRLVQQPQYTWRTPGFAQEGTHPAVIVTFNDAQRFLAWASQRAGRRLRLPTEAEWERACRAGTSTAWYTGDTVDYGRAAGWYNVSTPLGTRPVHDRLPNGYGLFDMVGHVQQWVDDWYAPYGNGAATDPQVPAPDPSVAPPARRVLRGGSWLRSIAKGRCAARERATPGSRNADTGFRVAMDASEGEVTVPPTPPAIPTPPDPEPPPPDLTQRRAGRSSDGIGYLVLIGGIATTVFGFLMALVSRSHGWGGGSKDAKAKPGAGSHRDIRLVAAADGFRVIAPAHRVGQRAHIEFQHAGQRRRQWVWLEAGAQGHFVYTGVTPEMLVVLAVADPTARSTSHAGGHATHQDSHGFDAFHGGHDHGSSFAHGDHGSSFAHNYHGTSTAHDDPAPMPTYQGPPSAY
jgi:formylglycine-generating enzyme required for sulfatase activity